MLADANALDDGAVVRSDVCLVGAGAAGITLARALAGHGLDVVMLESGGLDPDPATQLLYDAPNVGIPYSPVVSRLRYFGGSTNHWGGLCRRLEPDDFTPRPWIPHSGWPIGFAELAPWYDAALGVLEIPWRPHGFADVQRDVAAEPRLLGAANPAFEPVLWLGSPPTRFGRRYRDDVVASSRIRCWLHANALALEPDRDGRAVRRLAAATLSGRRHTFEAAHYVLCAGGIENARLLLASDGVVPGGLGNRHGLVGRCFMEHMGRTGGKLVVVPPAGVRGFQEEAVLRRSHEDLAGVYRGMFGLMTSPAFRARHRLPACSVSAVPIDAGDEPAVEAVRRLLAGGRPPAEAAARVYVVLVVAEWSPSLDSRVALADARDALGQRRALLDLRERPADRRNLRKSLARFALEIARSGHGRVQLLEEDETRPLPLPGGHHMGTTRMANDPRHGVTDRDGRVHGLANLWVAGSSLFVTSGFANPTLTIVALALRQAEAIAAAAARRAGAAGSTSALTVPTAAR